MAAQADFEKVEAVPIPENMQEVTLPPQLKQVYTMGHVDLIQVNPKVAKRMEALKAYTRCESNDQVLSLLLSLLESDVVYHRTWNNTWGLVSVCEAGTA
eukprot:gene8786-2919_t